MDLQGVRKCWNEVDTFLCHSAQLIAEKDNELKGLKNKLEGIIEENETLKRRLEEICKENEMLKEKENAIPCQNLVPESEAVTETEPEPGETELIDAQDDDSVEEIENLDANAFQMSLPITYTHPPTPAPPVLRPIDLNVQPEIDGDYAEEANEAPILHPFDITPKRKTAIHIPPKSSTPRVSSSPTQDHAPDVTNKSPVKHRVTNTTGKDGKELFACICGSKFITKRKLREHMTRTALNWVCRFCCSKHSSFPLLTKHLEKSHEVVRKEKIGCNKCGKTFLKRHEFLKHRNIHRKSTNFRKSSLSSISRKSLADINSRPKLLYFP